MSAQVTGRSLRLRGLAAAAALLAGGAGLLAATVAGGPAAQATARASAAPAAWGVAQRIPALDAIAAKGNTGCPADGNYCGGINIYAMSCPAPGDCTAGGDFYGQGDNDGTVGEGWVASESDGAWTAPKVIELGQGGFPSYVAVTAVSCASPGYCAAVGYDSEEVEANGLRGYLRRVRDQRGERQVERAEADPGHRRAQPDELRQRLLGVLQRPRRLRGGRHRQRLAGVRRDRDQRGLGHRGTGSRNSLRARNRRGRRAGHAPGDLVPEAGRLHPRAAATPRRGNVWATSVATETDGTWGDAVPLPGYAAAGGVVTSLSCPAVGDCSAGGWTYAGKHTVPFVASEVNGTWTSSALRRLRRAQPGLGRHRATSPRCRAAPLATAQRAAPTVRRSRRSARSSSAR